MFNLLSSKLYDEDTFYKAFLNDLGHCHKEVTIESPYMTLRRIECLMPAFHKLLKRGVKITINTRNPKDHDAYLQSQSNQAIDMLAQMGIVINMFSSYHHRKIAIIDKAITWEGSLNILSQNDSLEVMRRIKSRKLSIQMIKFLQLDKI